MTNTVLLKRSNTANAVPLAANLTAGELALNYTDGNLFYKNNAGNVVVIASNQTLSVTGNITGGNLLLSGIVSAAGNITSAANITGGNITTSGSGGNITGANVISATTFSASGNISAVGNISGTYFIGNGSLLTGISASGSGNSISNGTSNVVIPTANGSIYLSDDGVPNAAVFSNGSFTMAGSFATPKTTTANSTVTSNVNAMLLGPVTIGAGTTITVPSSSTLSIYSDNATPSSSYANANVAAYLASGTDTSNIITTANISGSYILGNGYYLTGISGGSATLSGNLAGNLQGNSFGANAFSFVSATGNVTGGNVITAGIVSATGNITAVANIAGGNITTAGIVSALGNITTANNLVYANTTSVAKAYQFYNSATTSIDVVFL